LIKNWSDCKK